MMNENISNQIESADVKDALNGILTTDKFSASPQMSAFLKYVVEQTLLGNTRRIKAFTVGIEALGKSSSFDPQTDPSVRVLAKRLRSSLDAYYEQNPDTAVFIEMKPGSYIPKFLLRSEMAATAPAQMAVGYDTAASQGNAAVNTANSAAGASAHVSVQQSSDKEGEASENRRANMNQLWQAYRSASKVA